MKTRTVSQKGLLAPLLWLLTTFILIASCNTAETPKPQPETTVVSPTDAAAAQEIGDLRTAVMELNSSQLSPAQKRSLLDDVRRNYVEYMGTVCKMDLIGSKLFNDHVKLQEQYICKKYNIISAKQDYINSIADSLKK